VLADLQRSKGLAKLDGSDPLLLNGYCSYEICNDPYFSSNRLCLLDRGFVFAIAHGRGGGEMGRYWCGELLEVKGEAIEAAATRSCCLGRRSDAS
jgi:protease II